MSQEEGSAERILDAADELFSTRGFAAVSMRDVAEQAGVKKASVFYHHGSKSVLFDKVLARYYEAHVAALSRAADGPGTVSERLHRLIDAYLDFIEDHQRYVRLVQMEIASASENLPRIRHGLGADLGPRVGNPGWPGAGQRPALGAALLRDLFRHREHVPPVRPRAWLRPGARIRWPRASAASVASTCTGSPTPCSRGSLQNKSASSESSGAERSRSLTVSSRAGHSMPRAGSSKRKVRSCSGDQ